MSRVLIVEDEAHLAKGLQFNLEAEGHSVEVARDGERALQLLLGHDGKRENFDAVVLDIMLPGKDGFAVASELRAAKNFVPVLMLTARSQASGSTSAAQSAASGAYDVFSFHGRTIDFGKLELRVNGNTIHLTLMEAELLRHLIRNNGRIVSRKSILEEVWGLHEDTDTRAIDNFIVRLRRYIEDNPAKPRHLLTVRGVGYRFVAEPEKG